MRCFFVAGLLCFSTPAIAEIFNGAPLLDAQYLSPHREIKMRELWPPAPDPVPDFSVIDESWVRTFVAALPNDRTYEFDLEGSSEVRSDNLHVWNYDIDRSAAITLRQNMMYIINNERPDLNIGVWGIPDNNSVREAIKDPTSFWRASNLGVRQVDYRGVMAFTDTAYVDAYWSWGPNEFDKLDEWKALVRMKIALSQVFFKQLPVVYVTHRGTKIDAPATVHPSIFTEMLDFVLHQCVDMVFWASQFDNDIPTWVQWELWRRANQPECDPTVQ